MSAPCIHVIGLGVSEPSELPADGLRALIDSDVVIGSPRQLELVKNHLAREANQLVIELPKLAELKDLIDRQGDSKISLLASGDPLYYGIGRWLTQNFEADLLCFHPAISSIQVVCHRLGIALQDADVVSLHGRPLSNIRRRLKRNRTLIILTDENSLPPALAQECIDAGFAESFITVCEDLGYANEKIRQWKTADLLEDNFSCSALHVSVIQVAGSGGLLPEFPGFADASFATDGEPGQGMISKREVRLAILSLMQPANDDVIWDIGAGCGSVSTELAYWNDRVTVFAIEQHQDRLRCLEANRQRFGLTDNLNIVQGRAPAALDDLPVANKVFIGGSEGELQNLLDRVWAMLPESGLLVASAVTDNTLKQLTEFSQRLKINQLESIQLVVSRGIFSESGMNYKAKHPVTLFKFIRQDNSK